LIKILIGLFFTYGHYFCQLNYSLNGKEKINKGDIPQVV